MSRLKKQDVIEALTETKGVILYASELLGCSRQTLYNYIERYEDVRQARKQAEEDRLDIAEQKLNEAVLRGESWAIRYILSTRGKDRGYTKKEMQTFDFNRKPQKIKFGDEEIEFL